MSSARIHIGLPAAGGIVRDQRSRRTVSRRNPDEWAASDLVGLRWDEDPVLGTRFLRPLPAPVVFAETSPGVPFNANRVTRLQNVIFGDGSAEVIRHDFSDFAELHQGVWTSRRALAHTGTGNNSYWGGAVCPIAASGKGNYVYSSRDLTTAADNQVFRWDGTAGNATGIVGANASRHVVAFVDRCFLFDQLISGTRRGRQAQWSVAGDCSTMTGTGSGSREFGEFEGVITNVGVLRGNLIVYSTDNIVAGVDAFDPDNPVRYTSVTGAAGGARSFGNWAPNSLIQYYDVHAFLSRDGFKTFDGSAFEHIGAPIDASIISRINIDALDTVFSAVKTDWHIAFWGLPMDGASVPNEGWFYDFKRNTWHRVDLTSMYSSSPTAAAIVDQAAGIPWDDDIFDSPLIAWNDASLSGKRWADFAGKGETPTMLTGHSDGITNQLDESQTNSSLIVGIRTPDFTFEAIPVFNDPNIPNPRSSTTIGASSVVTLDYVDIYYRTISGASTLRLSTSVDGGGSFKSYGAGTLSLPVRTGIGRIRAAGRASGQQIRLDIANVDAQGNVTALDSRIEDIVVSVRRSGDARGAA